MLFWFAGFIALAVLYHDIVGVANFEYFNGCGALGDYCGVTEAAVVFGALEWYVRFFISNKGSKELSVPVNGSNIAYDIDADYRGLAGCSS